jgi:hypothetical protein
MHHPYVVGLLTPRYKSNTGKTIENLYNSIFDRTQPYVALLRHLERSTAFEVLPEARHIFPPYDSVRLPICNPAHFSGIRKMVGDAHIKVGAKMGQVYGISLLNPVARNTHQKNGKSGRAE